MLPAPTILSAGWQLECEPSIVNVETPQDVKFILHGPDLQNPSISILRGNGDVVCDINNGEGHVIAHELIDLVKDQNMPSENFSVYIEGLAWPLCVAELEYNWGRIVEVNLDRTSKRWQFSRRAPPTQDTSDCFPISVEAKFMNQEEQILHTQYLQIHNLENLMRCGIPDEMLVNSIVCSIQLTPQGEQPYQEQWFMLPSTKPIRRLVNQPESIPLDMWYNSPNERVEVECEILDAHRIQGLYWRTANADEKEITRKDLVNMWRENNCSFEEPSFGFVTSHEGKDYPYFEPYEDGFYIHTLIEHNLPKNSADYFMNHVYIRCNGSLLYREMSRVSDNLVSVKIEWEKRANKRRKVVVIKCKPRLDVEPFKYKWETKIPKFMSAEIDITPEQMKPDLKYICNFAAKPRIGNLQITAFCKIEDKVLNPNARAVCNMDEKRPCCGAKGCGHPHDNCSCVTHKKAVIRCRCGPFITPMFQRRNHIVSSQYYHLINHDEKWYLALSNEFIEEFDHSWNLDCVVIEGVADERFEIKM